MVNLVCICEILTISILPYSQSNAIRPFPIRWGRISPQILQAKESYEFRGLVRNNATATSSQKLYVDSEEPQWGIWLISFCCYTIGDLSAGVTSPAWIWPVSCSSILLGHGRSTAWNRAEYRLCPQIYPIPLSTYRLALMVSAPLQDPSLQCHKIALNAKQTR